MLGSSYKVVATVGHLRDLPKSKMGVDIENDFEPQYITVRGKGPKINELKKLAKDAENIYLATDPDREGEAISWHLSHILELDIEDKNRVEFNEITKNFVKEAIKKPRSIDMNLVDAQQARRILDRIVGYKLSPMLWKKIKNGLSAGRVQSVALKLICDREEEINSFVPEEYWSIVAKLKKSRKTIEAEYFADLVNGKEKKCERIANEDEVNKIISSLDPKAFKLESVEKKKRRKNPYPPFTTSTLQQEANKKLGFSTSKTMRIAQQLYEGINIAGEGTVGLISYMRTDSTRLSSTIIGEAKDYIEQAFGNDYYAGGIAYDKKKAGSQDAHEAVRPSSIKRKPIDIQNDLSKDELKLYDLIWKRTVASQMKAAVYDGTTVVFNNNSRLFKSTGNIMIFDGFMRLWLSDEKQTELPEMAAGEILESKAIDKNQHFTKAKPRFTEASLVKTLEEDGIGRPSTYSAIINSLISRNYVELITKQFYPTKIGISVNDLLKKHFSEIINEEFTARMESSLDKIVDEKQAWKDIIRGFYGPFDKLLEKALKDSEDFKIKDKVLDEKCPECGKNLVEKNGRNGKFIGCTGFPDCKFTKAIVKTTGVECPKCGHEIVEKVSKRGKVFYGCSNYPACEYATWDKPTGEKCPKCSDLLLYKKNRHGEFIVCNNPNCDFEKEVPKK